MIEIVRGDILNATGVAAICHQVNCMNAMGSGVAKAIYSRWPEVKLKYHEYCSGKHPEELLGNVQIVYLNEFPSYNLVVLNIFGQLNYGKSGICYTDYSALERAFDEINSLCAQKSIALPYGFGCGLAGGDWQTVEKLIAKHLWNCYVKIYLKE